MLLRKKEEKSGRRRRKDIDIINDNDDIIAQLISDMKHAAQVDSIPKRYHSFFLCFVTNRSCFSGRSTTKSRIETSHK